MTVPMYIPTDSIGGFPKAVIFVVTVILTLRENTFLLGERENNVLFLTITFLVAVLL